MKNKYLNIGVVAESQKERQSRMKYLNYLDKYCRAGRKVLDMGCGDGVVGEYLRRRGLEVLGVDTNSELIEIARKNGCKAIKGDAMNFINTSRNIFDIYLMLDFIEHLEISSLETILDRIPGRSVVIIKTPNVDCLMGVIAYLSMPSHKQPIAKSVLKNLLIQKGFEVKSIFSVDFLLSPIFSPKLIFPKILIKLFPAVFDGGNYVCVALKKR
ncbi:MAG: hypothetical protein UX80_C0002G0044 [Candidatus Amesbacteria bacterium GW2011_GWA2_47_11b]|uniref:Methyltransferase domain-containing protein n=2 Tax=Candidatus Amesiibacteriota TaxID=1752730 RepID=A0A0G1UWE2_9BACT|nr:MAG: hypothetical protein UT95_C0003G0020 [Candidatus Curtissbacteria bacterium GW2011_GWB1_40_28]KKU29407.1 MAG: hypothetical protein UX42_C0001G0159 [Microgenomates group bacterium GW2011_GWC1_46_20]KKU58509.1 MAG: hypothetical protein UX80_C0002G0044 [Candidatus Amesbacteria bacterium GW2011_GWA2_47_11b]KKU70348.1 MAG: hypothetical protein UX92_C0001G0016 [Candidatus Amesbacteria bacterium GW2011_GWA1_47_20]HCH59287.1 hypothetical protein [Candidatus Zambryskibacteria bacterium]